MRQIRKREESFFANHFLRYFVDRIDSKATQIDEVVDRPDMAILSDGKVIGVELSQLPSDYIIRYFHQKMPLPQYENGRIKGQLIVYPYEPHRWVEEVIQKKSEKSVSHKARIKADEMWLVMHPHSISRVWPMSQGEQRGSREAEALLMRFGAKRHSPGFQRVFFVYADGEVVELTCGPKTPTAVTLPVGAKYPAVTTHQFSFSCDVPLPGLGTRRYQFNDITFDEAHISPRDDWMAERQPDIGRPTFNATASVNAEKMEWEIFRNGDSVLRQSHSTREKMGQTLYVHLLLEWSIQKATFTWTA